MTASWQIYHSMRQMGANFTRASGYVGQSRASGDVEGSNRQHGTSPSLACVGCGVTTAVATRCWDCDLELVPANRVRFSFAERFPSNRVIARLFQTWRALRGVSRAIRISSVTPGTTRIRGTVRGTDPLFAGSNTLACGGPAGSACAGFLVEDDSGQLAVVRDATLVALHRKQWVLVQGDTVEIEGECRPSLASAHGYRDRPALALGLAEKPLLIRWT